MLSFFNKLYPHRRDAPVVASTAACWVKEGQSNERDGGGDGEGTNEAHEEADEARETNQHLEEWAHNNGSLKLKRDISMLTVKIWNSLYYEFFYLIRLILCHLLI